MSVWYQRQEPHFLSSSKRLKCCGGVGCTIEDDGWLRVECVSLVDGEEGMGRGKSSRVTASRMRLYLSPLYPLTLTDMNV